jgi:hypothetical protein
MTEETEKNNIKFSLIYFSISTIITMWFIAVSPEYTSIGQKFLSCSIAGAKWGIQILAAFYFLQDKKWDFIKNISRTCLIGSIILLPYSLIGSFGMFNESTYFLVSLVLSVAVMTVSYFFSVRKSGLARSWWAGWLFTLAVAIVLQLKVVFNLTIF